MSSYPTAPSAVPPQLVSFKPPRRAFTILNSKPKPVSPMFGGNILTFPPIHEVGSFSDTDSDGDPIPGSRVIEDIFVYDPELKEEVCILDATRCVIHILGLQPGPDGTAQIASGSYAIGGLTLLPIHSPKQMWKQAAAQGEQRVFATQLEQAKYILKAWDEKNAKRRMTGMDPEAGDYEHQRALHLVNQANALIAKQVEEQLAPHQQDDLAADLELEIEVKALALAMAGRAAEGRDIDRVKLAQELLNDPKIRKALERTHKIRTRGNMPISAEKLEAAAVAGQTVADVELGLGGGQDDPQ